MGWSWRKALGMEERNTSSVNGTWVRLIPGWDDPNNPVAASQAEAIGAAPVFAAVDFLSSAMATMSRHVMRKEGEGSVRVNGGIANLLENNVNDEWTAFKWVKYSFWQTLTGGRSFTWIERPNGQILNLWPLDPKNVTVVQEPSPSGGHRTVYKVRNRGGEVTHPAADIIDLPFALEADRSVAA